MKDILQLPFIQVALPIIVAFVGMMFYQNKRLDDIRDSMNRRIDDLSANISGSIRTGIIPRLDRIEDRLARIEDKLGKHDERIARLEERTSILRA